MHGGYQEADPLRMVAGYSGYSCVDTGTNGYIWILDASVGWASMGILPRLDCLDGVECKNDRAALHCYMITLHCTASTSLPTAGTSIQKCQHCQHCDCDRCDCGSDCHGKSHRIVDWTGVASSYPTDAQRRSLN